MPCFTALSSRETANVFRVQPVTKPNLRVQGASVQLGSSVDKNTDSNVIGISLLQHGTS
jgi:hypothetical protein